MLNTDPKNYVSYDRMDYKVRERFTRPHSDKVFLRLMRTSVPSTMRSYDIVVPESEVGEPLYHTIEGADPKAIQKKSEKSKKQWWKEQALIDPLTKLPNRLAGDLILAEFQQDIKAMVIIDLDHFKAVNDTYGHQMGDEVLQKVAGYISDKIIAQRFGGEEFTCYLVGDMNIEEYLNGIREGISELKFSEPEIKVTATIGWVNFDPQADIEELFAKIDKALYYRKENGRNQVVEYNESMDGKVEGAYYNAEKSINDFRQIAYWITDTGDILDATKGDGHAEYICDNLPKLVKKYPILEQLKEAILEEMITDDEEKELFEELGWDDWYGETGYTWISEGGSNSNGGENREFVYEILIDDGWIAFEVTTDGAIMTIECLTRNLGTKVLDKLVLKYISQVEEIWINGSYGNGDKLDKETVLQKGLYEAYNRRAKVANE